MPTTFTFTDPAGVETILNDGVTTDVMWGVRGRHMPPFTFDEDRAPDGSGMVLRGVDMDARNVDVPIYVETPALDDYLSMLADRLNPMRGDGVLRCRRADGTERQVTCRYSAGFEGEEDWDTWGVSWTKVVLVFRAFDPLWQDVMPTVSTFSVSVAATFFPFFPLFLTGSDVFTDQPVTNPGHERGWPVWTITGPGLNLAFRNLTTGRAVMLNRTIASGEIIIIDTRPGRKTVRDGAGNNLYGLLASNADYLWPLERGLNNIRVELDNATVASRVDLSVRWRWLTP